MLPKIHMIPFDLRVLAVMFLALGVTALTSEILPRQATWTIIGIIFIIISIYIYITAEHTPHQRR